MLQTLIFTFLLFKASASQISGDGYTTAEFGGEARYRCSLDNPTGVLQVTWQKQFKGDPIENLATYNNRFGQQVNEPYKEKVFFTEASLSSTSITVKNITWEDEGCYICLFNAYPDGSRRQQTCLTVQGISEVKTHVHEEDGEVVFSCSATGKPAPTVHWDVSPEVKSTHQTETTTLTNSDHTFTSSRNMTLQLPPDWGGHVDCLLNKGRTGRRQQRIPFSQTKGEDTEKGRPSHAQIVLPIVFVVIFLSAVAVVAARRLKRTKTNGGIENVL